jgi:predicted enzyme related to lactoylglutathione lyase
MLRGPALTAAAAIVCLSLSANTGAAVPSFELPPLVQPASTEQHPGKVIWTDLVTADLAGAKHFYGNLFNWTFTDIHTGSTDYSLALLDGNPVGGLVERTGKAGAPRHPGWLTFISVRDVGQAQRIVVSHGGKVLAPPHTYAQRGRQAVFADPQGAVFAVLQSSSGDPEDFLAASGEWIWSSLVSHDAGGEAAFYQNVFGYEVFDSPADDGLEHVLLATDDYARASSNTLPPEATNSHPHWLNFIRVVNARETASKVEGLGGRVLVEPHADRHGGLIAVVADPAGAAFGLLEWTQTDSKEVRP